MTVPSPRGRAPRGQDPRQERTLSAQHVVVGGGTAGSIVAARLAKRGHSVVLVEAGPDFPGVEATPRVLAVGAYSEGRVTTRDYSWHWHTELTEPGGAPYVLYSGRTIGGGSSVNGQVWLRGLPADFDDVWQATGATDWRWDDVRPWYDATEDDLDHPGRATRGPVPVRRVPAGSWHPLHTAFVSAFVRAGVAHCPDLNAPGATGVGAQPFNNVDGRRVSTAFSHLLAARELPNLCILGNHMVDRVLFDEERATGVRARDRHGGTVRVEAADELILAAGAIGTPWLLMRSGIGDAAAIAHHGIPVVADVPGVGQGLREHPQLGCSWRAAPSAALDHTSARSPVTARVTAPGSGMADDLKFAVQTFSDDHGDGLRVTVFLMLAQSAGSVTLSPDGPDEPPVVDIGFLTRPEDRRRLRGAVRIAVRVTESSPLSGFVAGRIAPTDAQLADDDLLDAWLYREVHGSYHPSSTCGIGRVVDQSGLVTGVRGLRIVDASIMPDTVRANINATVCMMAERLATRIGSTAGVPNDE